jgi:hypothetical protein
LVGFGNRNDDEPPVVYNRGKQTRVQTCKKSGRTWFFIASEFTDDTPISSRLLEIMEKDYAKSSD